jgi:hypothetical protein
MESSIQDHLVKRDGVFRILMIGNSFCQRYLHELHGMAAAAGISCRLTSVVAGACILERHWNWCRDGEKHYCVLTMDDDGLRTVDGWGLDDALALDEWDAISYQDGEYYYRLYGADSAREHMEPYLGNLVKHVRDKFPRASHWFHQVWAYQVGYDRPAKSPFKVPDAEVQATMHQDLRDMTLEACAAHGLARIPSGDAWALARADRRLGDTLCANDCEHDGDVGGGQYLNACVWFETMFGLSCLGNAYRPPYALEEGKIEALQEAAHRAVEDAFGETYARS